MKDILPLIELPFPIMMLTPIFFVIFMGVIVWVYRSGSRQRYQKLGELPLDDGTHSTDNS